MSVLRERGRRAQGLSAAFAAGLVLPAALLIRAELGAQQVFRSGIDLVNFGVTVVDRRGNLIKGLVAADFELVEEGRQQTIRYFLEGDKGDDPPAFHIGLLFDTSGSMGEDIKMSRTAAVKFINKLTAAEDVTLVDFDTEVRVAKYSQSEMPRLIERIRMRKPDGWTALYDALGIYLSGAQDQTGRKVLVLYTDGGDTRSAVDFRDVLGMLKASDVTVYAIGFLEHQPSSVRGEQRMRLEQIARATGGTAHFPFSADQLDGVYDRIADELASRYTLGYLSTDERADGAWRDVKIRVKRPELKDVKIRTRPGYFAPFREGSSRPQ
ncbi:MAG TPA: VWA domain-containing protein [Vicinamibacterales bacterium]|jgi:VWFA-related protein|nr:VWA domain-containing protein [Vicinamibacterales bacterium]